MKNLIESLKKRLNVKSCFEKKKPFENDNCCSCILQVA